MLLVPLLALAWAIRVAPMQASTRALTRQGFTPSMLGPQFAIYRDGERLADVLDRLVHQPTSMARVRTAIRPPGRVTRASSATIRSASPSSSTVVHTATSKCASGYGRASAFAARSRRSVQIDLRSDLNADVGIL
jgi:hypothetical protein